MAQAVGRGMLAETCRARRLPTGVPDHVGTDGNVSAHRFDGTWKQKSLGLHPAPVDAQSFQQLGAQWDIAVAAALTLFNANHHALTVHVAYLQTAQFGPAQGGGVQRRYEGAVIEIGRRMNEPGLLLWTEHGGEPLGALGERDVLGQKVAAQGIW